MYQMADLHTARLLPLSPQLPLAGCLGSGTLLPLAAHIAIQLGAFADVNFFYADEKGGRFVFHDEPLEWGVRYRMLTKAEFAPPADLTSLLDWRVGPKLGEWHSCEIALPLAFTASRPNTPAQIATFLGRRIRHSRPRLFVVQPSPHHIEIDGTYVFPAPPDSILVRRSAGGKITVGSPIATDSISVTELSDEWVQLANLPLHEHDCTLSIDGDEQVVFRVEECGLFQPAGLIAKTQDISWDLCTDSPILFSDLLNTDVAIECGSERIADHICRLNVGWTKHGSVLSSPAGIPKAIYAGSFGELRSAVASVEIEAGPVRAATAASGLLFARQAWVEGLIAKTFGQEGLGRVRHYLADPAGSNLYRLGHIVTSRLMPYVRAVHEQKHGQEAWRHDVRRD